MQTGGLLPQCSDHFVRAFTLALVVGVLPPVIHTSIRKNTGVCLHCSGNRFYTVNALIILKTHTFKPATCFSSATLIQVLVTLHERSSGAVNLAHMCHALTAQQDQHLTQHPAPRKRPRLEQSSSHDPEEVGPGPVLSVIGSPQKQQPTLPAPEKQQPAPPAPDKQQPALPAREQGADAKPRPTAKATSSTAKTVKFSSQIARCVRLVCVVLLRSASMHLAKREVAPLQFRTVQVLTLDWCAKNHLTDDGDSAAFECLAQLLLFVDTSLTQYISYACNLRLKKGDSTRGDALLVDPKAIAFIQKQVRSRVHVFGEIFVLLACECVTSINSVCC